MRILITQRYLIGNELLFDNGNVNHFTSIMLGYLSDKNQLSGAVKVSGGNVQNKIFGVKIQMVRLIINILSSLSLIS